MVQKIKDRLLWFLFGILGSLFVILFRRESSWVWNRRNEIERREKEIKEKKKEVEKKKQQANDLESKYKEMMKKHDEEIESVGKILDSPDFDNPDDAADYLNDILSDAGGRTRRR